MFLRLVQSDCSLKERQAGKMAEQPKTFMCETCGLTFPLSQCTLDLGEYKAEMGENGKLWHPDSVTICQECQANDCNESTNGYPIDGNGYVITAESENWVENLTHNFGLLAQQYSVAAKNNPTAAHDFAQVFARDYKQPIQNLARAVFECTYLRS